MLLVGSTERGAQNRKGGCLDFPSRPGPELGRLGDMPPAWQRLAPSGSWTRACTVSSPGAKAACRMTSSLRSFSRARSIWASGTNLCGGQQVTQDGGIWAVVKNGRRKGPAGPASSPPGGGAIPFWRSWRRPTGSLSRPVSRPCRCHWGRRTWLGALSSGAACFEVLRKTKLRAGRGDAGALAVRTGTHTLSRPGFGEARQDFLSESTPEPGCETCWCGPGAAEVGPPR